MEDSQGILCVKTTLGKSVTLKEYLLFQFFGFFNCLLTLKRVILLITCVGQLFLIIHKAIFPINFKCL